MTITLARRAPGMPAGLKLALVLAIAVTTAAGLAAWLEPRLIRDPVGAVGGLLKRAKLDLSMAKVPDGHAHTMAMERAADGAVWVLSKSGVVRYADGAPDRGRRLLDADIFRGLFHGPMEALSALHVESTGEAWVGTWDGQVLRRRSGTWTRVSDRESGPRARIRAIVRAGAATYVGGQGLWEWSSARGALHRVESFPAPTVTALARTRLGELVVGSPEGVHVRRDGEWRTLWRTERDDTEVNGLFVTAAGHLLVATHDGYLVLDPLGGVLYRELAGYRVTGFAQLADGDLWVSTWNSGVLVRSGGAWRRIGAAQGLDADSLSALQADRNRRLWLGIHGHGLAVVDAASLKEFAVDPAASAPVPGAVAFPSACEAAAARLGGAAESGGIAVEPMAGRGIVFFNGRQVCPTGVGHRRGDRTMVTVADNTVHLTLRGESRLLPLPARAARVRPTAVFVDSRDRLWLGFRERGLFVYEGTRWRAHGGVAGLAGNSVRGIAEDRDGNIWVVGLPPADAAPRRRGLARVHRFDGETWTHFRPTGGHTQPAVGGIRQGLASAAANSVRLLGDGRIAIGTDRGLSLYEDGTFSTLVRSDPRGLPSNYVADVVEGPDGGLWMTHSLWGLGITWRTGFLFHNRNAGTGLLHDRIEHVAFDAHRNAWMQSSSGEIGVYPLASLLD